MIQNEMMLSILLSGPLIVTLVSLFYFFLKTGVSDLLNYQQKLESDKSNRLQILYFTVYIASSVYMYIMLEKTIFDNGLLKALFIMSIITNVTSLFLFTSRQ